MKTMVTYARANKRLKTSSDGDRWSGIKISEDPPSCIITSSEDLNTKEDTAKVSEIKGQQISQKWWLKNETSNSSQASTKTKRTTKERKPKPISKPEQSDQKNQVKLTQTFLDFGQKHFDGQVCGECGLMYVPGVPEDMKTHAEFHDKHQNTLNFVKWHRWDDHVVVRCSAPHAGVIMMVDNLHQEKVDRALKTKMKQLRDIVDKDLGFATINKPELVCNLKMYVYINEKNQVAACVIVERIESAFPIIDEKPQSESPSSSTSCSSVKDPTKQDTDQDGLVVCNSSERKPAILGISRIWTLKSERRKGLASRLVDAARANMVYNYKIKKEECACSQPTAEGRKFFRSYMGTNNFLVYL